MISLGGDDGLKPFFTYFGGKYRAAPRYPKPAHDTIIEPFAGSAGYSVRNANHKVRLYDIDPVICSVWDYLIHVNPSEVLRLPLVFEHVDTLNLSQEARWLIGFWLNKGCSRPRKSPSAWMRNGRSRNNMWGEVVRQRIASQVDTIRHWTVANRSYEQVDDSLATWFIDPPYQGKCGRNYRYSTVDFTHLSQWSQTRMGQVIVCEQVGADWLPFQPLGSIKGNYQHSEEAIWTQEEE